MISLSSWRCLSRRALARISVIVMFGESSMNNGASLISPIRRASFDQWPSLIPPARILASGMPASAESSRMTISLRLISREKMTLPMPCLMEQDRTQSRPSVDFPTPGRAATMII